MNLRRNLVCFWLCASLVAPILSYGESWEESLARMPLPRPIHELNRTNCVELMLAAFQANDVVKALVFMPGATDEFYLFGRARATLTSSAPTLLDAVTALTNQTFIQASFCPPLLLLHTTEDPMVPVNRIEDLGTAQRLEQRIRLRHLSCNDKDWEFLEPILRHSLKLPLRPWHDSPDSWHFYRHSFAAWNVNGLEALQIAAWAGKSRFTLRRREAVFELDRRVQAPPHGR